MIFKCPLYLKIVFSCCLKCSLSLILFFAILIIVYLGDVLLESGFYCLFCFVFRPLESAETPPGSGEIIIWGRVIISSINYSLPFFPSLAIPLIQRLLNWLKFIILHSILFFFATYYWCWPVFCLYFHDNDSLHSVFCYCDLLFNSLASLVSFEWISKYVESTFFGVDCISLLVMSNFHCQYIECWLELVLNQSLYIWWTWGLAWISVLVCHFILVSPSFWKFCRCWQWSFRFLVILSSDPISIFTLMVFCFCFFYSDSFHVVVFQWKKQVGQLAPFV